MRIGYFGGTFDPIHLGHIAVARAALKALRLDQVLFVPTDVPPHKQGHKLAGFEHRYAMLALALREAREPRFLPSLLESPRAGAKPRYSVDTIRALKRKMGAKHELFFLIGIDAFMEIAQWRRPEQLLRECPFVVVSRPGFSLAQAVEALPAGLRPRTLINRAPRRAHGARTLQVRGVTIHLLEGVQQPESATAIRDALRSGSRSRKWRRWLPPAVAEYIQKMHLYEGR